MQINKASVYLRTVGATTEDVSYGFEKNSYCAFAASNFAQVENNNFNCVFKPLIAESYFNGSLYIYSNLAFSYPLFSYPIKSADAGKIYVYLRLKSATYTSISAEIHLDEVLQNTDNFTISLNEFVWLRCSVIMPDNKSHVLGIKLKNSDIIFDCVCITNDDVIPTTLKTTSNFCTLHATIKSETTGDNLFYDYKTNIDEIQNDGWYNFKIDNLDYFDGESINLAMLNFCLFVIGSTKDQYIIWDEITDNIIKIYDNEKYGVPKTTFLNYNQLSQVYFLDSTQKFALKLYEAQDGVDLLNQKIVIPPAKVFDKKIDNFTTEVNNQVFIQTEIATVTENTNKVVLSLNDRLLTIIMDQSGSMTWNDNAGLRHKLAKRLLDRIEATYPGDVKWNLLSFGGIPVRIDFYGVLESDNVNTTNASSISSTFFREQDSGFAGVRVIRNADSFPLNPLDGEIIAEGITDRVLDNNLEIGKTYYYAAYTYGTSGNFSAPKYAKVTVQPKIIPNGIGNYKYRILTGTGVSRDANTLGLYHLSEGVGNACFDFADNNARLQASDSNHLWLNKNDVPTGTSGLRLNGTTYFISEQSHDHVSNAYTVMAWVQPFNFSRERIILAAQNNSQEKIIYQFGIDTNGKLFFSIDAESRAVSEFSLSTSGWQHVAVVADTNALIASFYIDGIFAGTATYLKGNKNTSSAQKIMIGSPSAAFFGRITEISVHNVMRSENYILKYSRFPMRPGDKIGDNGDRLVILQYNVSELSDYLGNQIKIIRKPELGAANYTSDKNNVVIISTGGGSEVAPADPIYKFDYFGNKIDNITDGDEVYVANATSGEKTISLPYDYLHGVVYNFRVYVINKLGNVSVDSESHNLGILIPYFSSPRRRNKVISKPLLPRISNFFAIAGNKKAYLYWDQPTSEFVEEIRIYWNEKEFPVFDEFSNISNESLLVFIGDKTSDGYVDRFLLNDLTAYYAIVTCDRYGNASSPVYLRVIPHESVDETNIPLDTVKSFGYDLINEETVSLRWDLPVTFDKMIEGYFDERVILFARITDIYGGAVQNIEKAKINITARINAQNIPPDFFNGVDTVQELKAEETYIISSTLVDNTTIKGVFRMVDDAKILASLNFLLAVLDVSFSIPDIVTGDDKFIVYSNKIGIRLINPLSMDSEDGLYGAPSGRGTNKIVQTRRTFAGSGDGGANQTGEDGGEEDGDIGGGG